MQAFLHQLNPKALLPHLESEKAQKLERKVGRKKSQSNKSKNKQNSDDDEMIAPRILFCDYLICTKSTSELCLCIKIITIACRFLMILDVINTCCHF